MNPALFAYTYGALGLEMAVARTVTAFSIGLVAGFGTHLLQARGTFAIDLLPAEPMPAVAGGSGGGTGHAVPGLGRRFLRDLGFITRWFTLGVLIAAVSATFLSPDLVGSVLGSGSRWAVPAGVLLGIPLYACGGGAIPIVETMIRLGMTPGAALAFFIAGPATKFHTIGALGAEFGRRVLVWYLIVMSTGALVWGYVYPFTGVLRGKFSPAFVLDASF